MGGSSSVTAGPNTGRVVEGGDSEQKQTVSQQLAALFYSTTSSAAASIAKFGSWPRKTCSDTRCSGPS